MKFQVRTISKEKCAICLIPENDLERKLLDSQEEADQAAKADTFSNYYQRAINYKYGPTAHLMQVTPVAHPAEVIAGYVLEGAEVRR
jgi:hypothetical protein